MSKQISLLPYLNDLQTQVDNLQNHMLPSQAKKVESIQQKIQELSAVLNANVNLMDDVLTHANSVLTTWVGFITIFVAVVTISIMLYLNKEKNKEVARLTKEAFSTPEFKKTHEAFMARFVKNEDFKSQVEVAIKNSQKETAKNDEDAQSFFDKDIFARDDT